MSPETRGGRLKKHKVYYHNWKHIVKRLTRHWGNSNKKTTLKFSNNTRTLIEHESSQRPQLKKQRLKRQRHKGRGRRDSLRLFKRVEHEWRILSLLYSQVNAGSRSSQRCVWTGQILVSAKSVSLFSLTIFFFLQWDDKHVSRLTNSTYTVV